jgi:hypothetical protein
MMWMECQIDAVLLVKPWYPRTMGGVAVVTERFRRLLSGAGVATYVRMGI